ncbi:tRNA methyltransferase complex GCD14 subunit, partial [Cystobasidium minutum MCA 4210]|uniref:tRNA methyltransferase complex GCD14 subunit n=1 Tax=Cystobasidium minutum MCA 4210 TaxID=1397322 RepID=UPI0034CDAA42
SRDSLQPVIVHAGETTHTRYGSYSHSNLIGRPFGSKVFAGNGRGFCHVLRPTPELWSMSLPHRTQILYLPDIAYISAYLDIKPGTRVVEAGTGSGSFSHSLARTVGTSGKVFSFEFHEPRYEQAKLEFENHGLAEVIELRHRNVCKDGFSPASDVDSVFLDVPAPWEAIDKAKAVLAVSNRMTRICCFSPCIEQVSKTVTALQTQGFSHITMYETLVRQHDAAIYQMPTIDDAIDKLKDIE